MIYAYIRVSTLRQSDEGESLGAQQRALEGYCQFKGLGDPVLFIERGVSGSIPLGKRPEGGKLLSLLAAGDVLLVPKLDRAFRSALDALDVLGHFKKTGIGMHFLDIGEVTGDGNGIGKLVFTILAAVAEAERDRTIERICEVKRDQKERGRYLGGDVPWGYVVEEGALVESPDRAPAIDAMKLLRGQGMSLRRVSEEMRRRGVPISHEKVRQAIAA